MKTALIVVLILLSFAAGALISGAVAHGGMAGGMMDGMSGEQMRQMMDACSQMMNAHAQETAA